jgi:hypothetical protein
MSDDCDRHYRQWCMEQRRKAVEDHQRECKAVQARLRCPNCGTIWECRCTPEQAQAAWGRIEARRQAEYHARVRACDEDLARRQAEWEKRHGAKV